MPKLPQKKKPGQAPPTLPLALLLLLICGGGFFGLLSLVIPGAGMLGLVLIILGMLFVAQYFVWGRSMHAWAVKREQEAEAKAEAIRLRNAGDQSTDRP